MPFITGLAGRLGAMGKTLRPLRSSWTSPRLTDAPTPVERALTQALTRHATNVTDAVVAHVGNVADFAAVETTANGYIPAALQDAHPLLVHQIYNILTEEIVQAGAESLATEAAHLSVPSLQALDARHADLTYQAALTGQPLPSQIGMPPPPTIPPPPAAWARLQGPGGAGPQVWLDLRLDLVNPYAVDYAARAALNLAGKVEMNTLDAVRSTVANGYRDGWTVDQMAELIQTKIGLFPRWSNAVDRRYTSMLTRGSGADFAMASAQKYADELKAKRAQMIARTETMRASNYGRLASWQSLVGAGIVDPTTARKQWLTGPAVMQADKVNPKISGPCDICAPMADVTVPLGGMFTTVDGEQIEAPPAHPHCRCTVLLIQPEPPSWDEMGGEVQWLQAPDDFSAD